MWKVAVTSDPNPSLGRIVIAQDWTGDVETARSLLAMVVREWPSDVHLSALVTCGAFLTFDWPAALRDVGDNKNPELWVLKALI